MDLVVRMVVMVSTDRMNKLQVVSSQHGMDGERMEEAVKSTLEEGGGVTKEGERVRRASKEFRELRQKLDGGDLAAKQKSGKLLSLTGSKNYFTFSNLTCTARNSLGLENCLRRKKFTTTIGSK